MADQMNLTERAYALIYEKLTGGQIPPGTRLTNRAVAKEMGISLTPIHGAFNRLVTEGLLEYRPGVGVFVPLSNRRDIEEIYQFREVLECAAVAMICGRLSDRVLDYMKRCHDEIVVIMHQFEKTPEASVDREEIDHLRSVDSEFHMALLRAAGNRRMAQTAEELRDRMLMISHQFYDERPANIRRTVDEHERIFSALCKGDVIGTQQLLSEHIRVGCTYSLETYNRHYMEQTMFRPAGLHTAAQPRWGAAATLENT